MFFISTLALIAAASAAPINAAPTPVFTRNLFALRANSTTGDFQTQNGLDAQKLNAQFQTLQQTDACNSTSLLSPFLFAIPNEFLLQLEM